MVANAKYLEVGTESCEEDGAAEVLQDSNGKTENSRQWKARVLVPVATLATFASAVILFRHPGYGPSKNLSQFVVDEIERKNAVVDDAMKKELLDRHNAYRCMHEAAPMAWDDAIAQAAQSWANEVQGKMEHSPSHLRKDVAGISYLGENLAWNSMGGKAVDMWYDEVDCTSPKGQVTYFNEGSCATGHYTQVVWKSSTKLGCGVYDKLTVCMYGPGGNVGGTFEDEVLIPSKNATECGAPVTPVGIAAYLPTLSGQSSVDCNSACKADGQSSMKSMGASGNGKQSTWTCGCSQGDGVEIQCIPGWRQPFETCQKVEKPF